MTLPTLRPIENNTPGSATDIDFNFGELETYINTEVITRDGTVAMQAPLAGVDAVNADEYATLSQVQAGFPAGFMGDYGGDVAPAGWATCVGQTESSTDPTYAALFAVIGYKFGDAGGGNFNFPDYRRASNVGRDPGGTTEFDTVGKVFGQADSELLQHTHTQDSHTHVQDGGVDDDTAPHTHTISHNHAAFTSNTQNSSHVHDNGVANSDFIVSGTGGTGNPSATWKMSISNPADGPDFSRDSAIGTQNASHGHTVDIPNFSGTSGAAASTTNALHGHTDDLSNRGFVATNQNTGAGTTLDQKNYHPVVVSTRIIKL